MINSSWDFWGFSKIGPLHIKKGDPNQDCWMARKYKWGNVVVVSDGLGSKKHSDYGSKAACISVFEAAKSYKNNPKARNTDILRLIHAHWLVKIAPYSPSECSATCLFVIQIDRHILLGSLGDGMIAVYSDNTEDCFIITDKKEKSFSNYTYSLQSEFELKHWQTTIVDAYNCKAIILCTDGIADDLLPGREIDFAQELYSSYVDLPSKTRNEDVNRWLSNWPVSGHSDDKTIACLFRKGGFSNGS